MGVVKGSNLRLFVSGLCVAGATSCQLTASAAVINSNTKDNDSGWDENEVGQKSWQVSSESLVSVGVDATGKTTTDLLGLLGQVVTVKFDQTNGDKNRAETGSAISRTGSAIVTNIQMSGQVGDLSKFSMQMTGTGPLR